jgi:hypothetical protein
MIYLMFYSKFVRCEQNDLSLLAPLASSNSFH